MDPVNPTTENPEVISPVSPEPPVTSQPPTPGQKSNSITIISLGVFILLCLGAVAFFYNQNQQLKKMLANYQNQVATSPTPTATPDPTANWKTYSYSKFNYSFRIPANYVISESDSIPSSPKTLQEVILNETKLNGQGPNDITIDVQAESLNSTLKELVKGWSNQTAEKTINSSVWTIKNNPDLQLYMYLTQNGSKTYTVEGKNGPFIDQILSTFQFVTPTPSASPTISSDLLDAIKSYLAKDNYTVPIDMNQIVIGDSTISGNYAEVAYNFPNAGGAVLWLYKSNNTWSVVAGGQEPPSCSTLAQYSFPKEFACNP